MSILLHVGADNVIYKWVKLTKGKQRDNTEPILVSVTVAMFLLPGTKIIQLWIFLGVSNFVRQKYPTTLPVGGSMSPTSLPMAYQECEAGRNVWFL